MRKLNKPLLRRLARKLRRLRHEEHYNQDALVARTHCGTVACLAGHTVLLAGGRPTFNMEELRKWGEGSFMEIRLKGQAIRGVIPTARDLLGLSRHESNSLFYEARFWPKPFYDRFRTADPKGPSKQRPSRVAADLLDAIADGTVKL